MANLFLNVPRNRVGKIIIRNTCILSFRLLNVVISLILIRCFIFTIPITNSLTELFAHNGDNEFLHT